MTDRQSEPSISASQERAKVIFSVKRVWPCYADGGGAGRISKVTWDQSPPHGARYRVVAA